MSELVSYAALGISVFSLVMTIYDRRLRKTPPKFNFLITVFAICHNILDIFKIYGLSDGASSQIGLLNVCADKRYIFIWV